MMSTFISFRSWAPRALLLAAGIDMIFSLRLNANPVGSGLEVCGGMAEVVDEEAVAADGRWATYSVPRRDDGFWVPEFVRNGAPVPVADSAPSSTELVNSQAGGFTVPAGVLTAGSSSGDRVTIRLWVTNRTDGYWFPRFVKNYIGTGGAVSATPSSESIAPPVVKVRPNSTSAPRPSISAAPTSSRLRQASPSRQLRSATVVIAKAYSSEPALAVGAVPALMFERRKVVAPALARQLRLDVDQGIEKLGPELNPVPLAHSGIGASVAGAGPVLSGIEETVAKLESASRGGGGSASGSPSADAARRADEVRIIPDETKRREQFRAVSSFFDPPTIRGGPPTSPAASSATYEQK